MKYIPRIVDAEINELMEIMGAVLIEGCKWCGKSTTGLHHAKSFIEFQNPDKKQEYDEIKNTQPSLFLKGDKPRMFDEWQMYPIVWDSIRTDVDHSSEKGQYILTGSAKPSEGEVMHTGTGRISRVLMRPMSLFESGESTGEVSFRDIIDGKDISGVSKLSLEDLASIIVRGGWPETIDISVKGASRITKSYLSAVLDKDISEIDGVKRDKNKMEMLLRSLARNESTISSNSVLIKDIADNVTEEELTISRNTVADYLDVLNKLHLIENQDSFMYKIRSRANVGKNSKRHFTDPSLGCAALNITPDKLMKDLETFGFYFEALCERDLRIYAESLGGKLYHYRENNSGLEVDAIIEIADGEYAAFEIKLGSNQIEEAAKNLNKFYEVAEKKPKFMCIICGLYNAVVKRPDGIYVIPITALKN